MPLWRCPHCGIPQVESSRCWVCRRSTTSCAACRHFRRGVAGGLGVCGLDPRRLALRGSEMRACWEAATTTGSLGPVAPGPGSPEMIPVMAAASFPADRPVRTFVPVVTGEPAADRQFAGFPVQATFEDETPVPAVRPRRIPGYWSLWGDFEP